jgi:hypothetical protein
LSLGPHGAGHGRAATRHRLPPDMVGAPFLTDPSLVLAPNLEV